MSWKKRVRNDIGMRWQQLCRETHLSFRVTLLQRRGREGVGGQAATLGNDKWGSHGHGSWSCSKFRAHGHHITLCACHGMLQTRKKVWVSLVVWRCLFCFKFVWFGFLLLFLVLFRMRTWCEDYGSGVRLVVGVATEQRRCDEVALKGRGGVGRRDEEVQQPGVFSVTVLQFSFKLLLVILLKSLCTVCCFMVFWVLSEDTSCFYVDVMRDKLGSLQVSIGTFGWPFDVCMGVTLTLRFEFHGSAMWGRSIACWHCELVDLERLIVDVSGAVIWMVFVGYWEAGSHIRIEEDFYFTREFGDMVFLEDRVSLDLGYVRGVSFP